MLTFRQEEMGIVYFYESLRPKDKPVPGGDLAYLLQRRLKDNSWLGQDTSLK